MAEYNNRNDFSKPAPASDTGGMLPPQAVEIEEAVLGGMLIEHEAATMALELLRPADFYRKPHRHIFEVMMELYEKSNPLDIITVENELRDKKLLEECGGPGYLSELTRSVSSAANIEYHAQILTEKAIKRTIIQQFTEVVKDSYDPGSDPYELLDKAEKSIYELANSRRGGESNAISDILKKTLQHLEEIRGQKGGITGVPSGTDVDRLTAGWQRGDLIIIAARPSMGKTAFVLTVARNASLFPDIEKRASVALFSLEMSDQQLIQRLLTMEARVDAQAARTGRLKDDEFKRLIEAASRLFKAKIFIDDTPAISVMEMRSKCRRLKSEHDINLIIVDYLQLMRGNTNDRNSNREQEIATISRGLKGLAKELDVPVIALAQLSRAVEQRGGNKRPQLSDLRESGCLTGDTLILNPETGVRTPIRELAAEKGITTVLGLDAGYKFRPYQASNVFYSGKKPVFELKLRSGKRIKASANHPFLKLDGWKSLEELAVGDRIASVLPVPEIVKLAQSDVFWDEVQTITTLGQEDVYDISVPDVHNFVANDIVVHNSIEQDADVVCFLYRPEYYGITTDEEGQSTVGIGEVIIGKQRNGPVGDIKLQFVKEYARFENLTSYDDGGFDDGMAIDPYEDDEDDPAPGGGANLGPTRPNLPPPGPDDIEGMDDEEPSPF